MCIANTWHLPGLLQLETHPEVYGGGGGGKIFEILKGYIYLDISECAPFVLYQAKIPHL